MTDNENIKGERIAKVLARAGVASRREVERMIADGRIMLAGKRLETPATLVTSLKGIMVDGQPVGEVSQTKVWRCHKRRGTLTTHRDPEGRPTVFDRLPEHMGRVISVGRLDMNTEGLLLFTNDGELARWLELPANSVVRKYRVRVYGRVDEKALAGLKDGATIDGIHYGSIDAKLERQQGSNAWLTIAIREGKNREVRRVMEHLGLTVNRLIRTHYGPFSLGTLEVGAVVPVGEKQLYEVLPDYFENAPQAVGADKLKRDPSKWAKAKKPARTKPGASRKRKFEAYKKGDADAPRMQKPGERRTSKAGTAEAENGPKRRVNARTHVRKSVQSENAPKKTAGKARPQAERGAAAVSAPPKTQKGRARPFAHTKPGPREGNRGGKK